MKRIRIGTRSSPLAMAQAKIVAEALVAVHGELEVETVPLVSKADRTTVPLTDIGGKGLFTVELEHALRTGRIDLAVHSAKDVPTDMPAELTIAAIPERGDAADALVSSSGRGIRDLPSGATVGTCSLRRKAQLIVRREDLKVVAIRGNVETRLGKVLGGDRPAQLDATLLAMAGLVRSGLAGKLPDRIRRLETEHFIPAAGQGALLVQSLTPGAALDLASRIDDPVSSRAVLAERSVLRELSADCRSCIAVHVFAADGKWRGLAMVARPDGTGLIRAEAAAAAPKQVAGQLTASLRELGAEDLLPG